MAGVSTQEPKAEIPTRPAFTAAGAPCSHRPLSTFVNLIAVLRPCKVFSDLNGMTAESDHESALDVFDNPPIGSDPDGATLEGAAELEAKKARRPSRYKVCRQLWPCHMRYTTARLISR